MFQGRLLSQVAGRGHCFDFAISTRRPLPDVTTSTAPDAEVSSFSANDQKYHRSTIAIDGLGSIVYIKTYSLAKVIKADVFSRRYDSAKYLALIVCC